MKSGTFIWLVMPGLVPGIHVFVLIEQKTWMAGTSPAMTESEEYAARSGHFLTSGQLPSLSGRNA